MIEQKTKAAILNKFGERAKFAESLAPYVAYQIGGPADVLIFPRSEEELIWLSKLVESQKLPVTIIGTGTNLLVQDEGVRGVVLALKDAFCDIELTGETVSGALVRTGGGVLKPTLLDWALERGFSGSEFSAGVPGTIGGGIFMNAGTKYGCYADILKKIRLWDVASGSRDIDVTPKNFGYRHQNVVKDSVVLWTVFELGRGDPVAMKTEVKRIIAEREEKQPLDFPSCGSTFKNPEGYSAGRLIEKAGLKGLKIGGAEISLKHANFILNKGNARAADVLGLISVIKEQVKAKFSVELECEVIVVGGDSDKGQISD